MTSVTLARGFAAGGAYEHRDLFLDRNLLDVEDVSSPDSFSDVLDRYGLNWAVEQCSVQALIPARGTLGVVSIPRTIPGVVANVRRDSGLALSVTTKRYRPVQNDELAGIVDPLLKLGSTIRAAGSFQGGRRVWVAMRLPGELLVAGEPIEPLYFVLNGHDGGRALSAMPMPLRLYCTNQLPALRLSAKRQGLAINARHTERAVELALVDAGRIAGDLGSAMMKATLEANELARIKATERVVQTVLDQLWPTEGDELGPRTLASNERHQLGVRGMLALDHNANIADSAWGLYNAIVEHLDWGRRAPRDGDVLRRNLDSAGAKQKALDLVAHVSAGQRP